MEPPGTGRPSMLGRGLALLTAFSPDEDGVSLSELCRRAGLPKATGHRLVGELVEAGFVERAEHGLRLGMRMFELGHLCPTQRVLRERAEPFLRRLAESTQHTVHLAVRADAEICYVDKRVGRRDPDVPTRVGGRMPAHCTALGKALLAYAPPEQVEAVLDRGLRRLTPRTVTAPGMLGRQLVVVRGRGVATEHEEAMLGVTCIAAPVLDRRRRPRAAVSVTGSVHGLHPERLATLVRTAAEGLARALEDGD